MRQELPRWHERRDGWLTGLVGGQWAETPADQNAKDHAALVAAVSAGRINALVEEER